MIHYIKDIIRFPKLIYQYRELLWSFVNRELKARYEGSVLGKLWPVIQPIVLFAVYYLIFAKLLKLPVSVDLQPWGNLDLMDPGKVLEGSEAGWRATFFLVSGILPWICISESWMRCTGIVLENANLIKKIAFPSEFLPLYAVVLNHIYYFIGMVIFLTLVWCVNGALPLLILWLPLLIFLQALFITGLGMLTGALNIFIRDISQIVPLFTLFWMFISPVFYSPPVLILLGNEKQKELVSNIIPFLYLNPAYNLLTLYRDILKYGRRTVIDEGSVDVFLDQGISYDCLLIFAAQAILTFIIGYAYFQHSKGRFADEV